jgi:hypothetical protein
MDDQVAPSRPQRPLEILRARHGGMSKALKESFNERQRLKKAIRAALAQGPRSVPEIARACEIPPPKAMWHVMAMRRYGEIVEAGERDDYVLYALEPKGA